MREIKVNWVKIGKIEGKNYWPTQKRETNKADKLSTNICALWSTGALVFFLYVVAVPKRIGQFLEIPVRGSKDQLYLQLLLALCMLNFMHEKNIINNFVYSKLTWVPGSIPGPGAVCAIGFQSKLASAGFSPGAPVFLLH